MKLRLLRLMTLLFMSSSCTWLTCKGHGDDCGELEIDLDSNEFAEQCSFDDLVASREPDTGEVTCEVLCASLAACLGDVDIASFVSCDLGEERVRCTVIDPVDCPSSADAGQLGAFRFGTEAVFRERRGAPCRPCASSGPPASARPGGSQSRRRSALRSRRKSALKTRVGATPQTK